MINHKLTRPSWALHQLYALKFTRTTASFRESRRELLNTKHNLLIMFELNSNFTNSNTPTGHSNRISVFKSGPSCFETVEDLGGSGGMTGNSHKDRSQDSVTNFEMVEDELDSKIAH